ncbi:hypothetical protein HYFRA_00002422 [Hymenoscyphus fraxineus]|uniref:Piwi domain-containing protein n=1 Tax=Hymenoscyphus fraxineus TaxID=746836 RepID=A0A9N9LAX6_9HELO|nr:hypothetical protein HYFRA_00002422 [Hymenoscyphus fraxineus]
MILGADVTHPGTHSQPSCPSLAAVVATDTNGSSNYLASARVQEGREEKIIQELKYMVRERVLAWVNKAARNGVPYGDILPKMLLFYRDGVSESQYEDVQKHEVPQVKAGYTSALEYLRVNNNALYTRLMGNQPPAAQTFGLVVVVAAKRHSTRFFPQATSLPGTNVNLTAGNAFRQVFMPPSFENFYIQSHGSPLGTARSSYYVVIQNSNSSSTGRALDPRQLAKITNKLCYTSSRCLKGISIATPARYADLVCDRLRLYMRPAMVRNFRHPFQLPTAAVANETTPTEYANDTRLWRNSQVTGPNDNPWLSSLNNIMFYI